MPGCIEFRKVKNCLVKNDPQKTGKKRKCVKMTHRKGNREVGHGNYSEFILAETRRRKGKRKKYELPLRSSCSLRLCEGIFHVFTLLPSLFTFLSFSWHGICCIFCVGGEPEPGRCYGLSAQGSLKVPGPGLEKTVEL